MSVGIKGPITRDLLPFFCTARTFVVPDAKRHNRAAASCKVCGDTLPKGMGIEAHISHGGQIYLCGRCMHEVAMAHATVSAHIRGQERRARLTDAKHRVQGVPLVQITSLTDDPDGELDDAWRDALDGP